ncbi:MAG: class I SAM-dependent methyltransferase [Isosphaeraceae bacterium]
MTARGLVRRVATRIPVVKGLAEAYRLKSQMSDSPALKESLSYASPLPSLSEIRADRERIFAIPDAIPGVDLNVEGQKSLGLELAPFVADCPFPEAATPPWRYHGGNSWFSWGDSLVLHALIRHLRPPTILEMGSGFSSAVILDTVEHYLADTTRCTFIEPYPDRLRSLLRPDDERRSEVIVERVQNVGLGPFLKLKAGDILLIDSSHVAKVGSDVNWLVFEVLPRLGPGIYVHFHDIFYPFEYPEFWFERGFAATEAYLLRAFLMFNPRFAVAFWNDYLKKRQEPWLRQHLPNLFKGWSTSIWLRTTEAASAPAVGVAGS